MGGEPRSDGETGAATVAAPARPRRAKPDPRPSRLVISAGAVAALTVIGAGLVRFPVAAVDVGETARAGAATTASVKARRKVRVKRPVRYVRLKRGERAPRGAKVIREAAPAPRVVVRHVSVAAARPARKTVAKKPVTRTRQSG